MKYSVEVFMVDEGFVGARAEYAELNRVNLERIFQEALNEEYGDVHPLTKRSQVAVVTKVVAL